MGIIKSWLDSQDYRQGIEIYKSQQDADLSYIPFLEKQVENPSNEAKSLLFSELMRLSINEPAEPEKIEVTVAKTVLSTANVNVTDCTSFVNVVRSHINVDQLPSDMKALYDANGELWVKIKDLSAKAKDPATPAEEAQVLLSDLYNMEDQYNKNWDIIDDWYIASLEADPDKEVKRIALKVHKLTIRKALLENYIRRAASEEKKKAYGDELKAVKNELETLTGESIA